LAAKLLLVDVGGAQLARDATLGKVTGSASDVPASAVRDGDDERHFAIARGERGCRIHALEQRR
jgi:hypothetical protein